MWDIYRQPLPNWRYRLLPTDTRSLISAVFLGLGMTVALQIAERIDFAYSGGSLFLVAVLLVPQFENPAAMFYGLTGALIVAWINPVVANLTATSPLSFLCTCSWLVPIPWRVLAHDLLLIALVNRGHPLADHA